VGLTLMVLQGRPIARLSCGPAPPLPLRRNAGPRQQQGALAPSRTPRSASKQPIKGQAPINRFFLPAGNSHDGHSRDSDPTSAGVARQQQQQQREEAAAAEQRRQQQERRDEESRQLRERLRRQEQEAGELLRQQEDSRWGCRPGSGCARGFHSNTLCFACSKQTAFMEGALGLLRGSLSPSWAVRGQRRQPSGGTCLLDKSCSALQHLGLPVTAAACAGRRRLRFAASIAAQRLALHAALAHGVCVQAARS
jgi:hypothetical protein